MKRVCLHIVLLILLAVQGLNTLAQTSVDFEYYRSLIFLKVKINGNRANFLFLLNTSATHSAIDTRTADILRLPIVRKDSVEGTAGKESITIRKVDALYAGDALVKDLVVNCRDLSRSVTLNGRSIDGIIGTDFLKHFAVNIDFKKQELTFLTKANPGRQKSIAFEMIEGVPRFHSFVNDTLNTWLNYNSAVSTETGRNVYINVSYRQWRQIAQTCPNLPNVGYLHAMGVGGPLYLQVVKLKSMQLDTLDIKLPYVVIQPEEGYFKREDAVGFFGNNLLEKYNNITLDFLNNRMVFNDVKKQPPTKNRRGNFITNFIATKF